MKFIKTPLEGAYVVELEKREDERGFFARAFCVDEFAEHGLKTEIKQSNLSGSVQKGTTRGLHYQVAPMAEVKFIRCIKGSVFDVLVDMRPESPTYKQWFGIELTEENQTAIYIPEGFAHGHQTLEDNSQIMYLTTQVYSPEHERGIRWNDPAIGVKWPLEPTVVSDKDQAWPLLTE